jgi:site-specific recombinase XerD
LSESDPKKQGGGVLAARPETGIGEVRFAGLEAIPPEVEWFANITNLNTRRAYQRDVRAFMAFLSIREPDALRRIGRPHVIAWRKTLASQAPATIRRRLAAVSSLFDYLCERNAVLANPVSGVQRPKEGANEGKTPAISDKQARALLDAPLIDSVAGKRDRAILAVFLYHGPRRAELAGLRVGDLAERRGILHFQFHGKGGKIRYLPAHPIAVAAIEDYLSFRPSAAWQKALKNFSFNDSTTMNRFAPMQVWPLF